MNGKNLLKKVTTESIYSADGLLKSGDIKSIVQVEDNCYEALIQVGNGLLLPEMKIEGDEIDMHCQCCVDDHMCVHKVAILLATGILNSKAGGATS